GVTCLRACADSYKMEIHAQSSRGRGLAPLGLETRIRPRNGRAGKRTSAAKAFEIRADKLRE
ncbi:MAG: hypothetical protein ACRD52_14925, partial [Candidatus Acidiferrales bacterium]